MNKMAITLKCLMELGYCLLSTDRKKNLAIQDLVIKLDIIATYNSPILNLVKFF